VNKVTQVEIEEALCLHNFFEVSADFLFHSRPTANGSFVFTTVNPAGAAYAGREAAAFSGATPEHALGVQAGGILTAALRRACEAGRPMQEELKLSLATGTYIFATTFVPNYASTGIVSSMFCHAHDITERRRLETALRQAQKMEVLGKLAGGIAHDFNNLLSTMLACLNLLARRNQGDDSKEIVAECRRTVQRGAALTSRLLAFSRQQPIALDNINLNTVLQDMHEMLVHTLNSTIKITQTLAPDLRPVLVDSNQIELAVLNLAINARDAMPQGGCLGIETANVTLRAAEDGIQAGEYVTVTIWDTGHGMTSAVLAKAADPFFTTKESGQGTGLGLSMVRDLVQQLQGGMKITSEPGQGTCITLFIPATLEVGAYQTADCVESTT